MGWWAWVIGCLGEMARQPQDIAGESSQKAQASGADTWVSDAKAQASGADTWVSGAKAQASGTDTWVAGAKA